MPSVLFVCTGNQYRSPVAASCFERLLKGAGVEKGWSVASAGTWAAEGQSAPAESRRAAAQLGINLDQHRARVINQTMLQNFDLIVVMERGQKEAIGMEFPAAGPRVRLLTELAGGPPVDVLDPISTPAETAELMRGVCRLVEQGFPRIKQLAEDMAGNRG